MQRNLELDSKLEAQLSRAAAATKQEPSVILIQALQIGLPLVAEPPAQTRPDGYFADDYAEDNERIQLENSMINLKQFPER